MEAENRVQQIMKEISMIWAPITRDAGMNMPEHLSYVAQCRLIEQNETIIQLLNDMRKTFAFEDIGDGSGPTLEWERGLTKQLDSAK